MVKILEKECDISISIFSNIQTNMPISSGEYALINSDRNKLYIIDWEHTNNFRNTKYEITTKDISDKDIKTLIDVIEENIKKPVNPIEENAKDFSQLRIRYWIVGYKGNYVKLGDLPIDIFNKE